MVGRKSDFIPTISAILNAWSFLIVEATAFVAPIAYHGLIMHQEITAQVVLNSGAVALAVGVFYVFGAVRLLLEEQRNETAHTKGVLEKLRDTFADVTSEHSHLSNVVTVHEIAQKYQAVSAKLKSESGPAQVFFEHADKGGKSFLRDLSDWENHIIKLRYAEYAERLGFLCRKSERSIDALARVRITKFWEQDWREVLESHQGKKVRRVFVFSSIKELDDYKPILLKHGGCYGENSIRISSEHVLEKIHVMLEERLREI